VAGVRYQLISVDNHLGPNYLALRAQMKVFEGEPGDEREVGTLLPEKRRYVSSAMPMTEAAIDRNLWRDRYVSLGEPFAGEPPQWSFRVYHKPFVSWIWLGAVFMVFGGGLAALDRRYRQAASSARAPSAHADKGAGLSTLPGAAPPALGSAAVAKGAVA
jgi:cytochrome c-type biogenesis protein CcmF